MKSYTHAVLIWLLCCLFVIRASAQTRDRREQLVPASFGQVNDVNGNPWDVQSNGAINNGYNDCFDGAMFLKINGTDFQSSGGQMLASPREYVLSNMVANVKVTRRILIDTKRGAARYLEVFENIQSSPISLNVQLRTMLGGSCQQVVSSTGQPFAGVLGKKDSGFCAIHPSNRPCVYFLVADPRSKYKPTISVQSNRTFTMAYTLKLKPRQTVSLLHTIAQRRSLPATGVAGVAKQFFHRKPIDADIPKSLSRTVLNFRLGPIDYFDAGPLLQTVTDISDYFDVTRGEGDFLVLGEEARFKGKLHGSHFVVETQFGQTKVPLDDVAMLIGGNGVDRPMQLYLRNGEVILGEVTIDESFVFQGERGLDVKLRPESLDLLLMRTNKQLDGKANDDVAAIITTQHGQRLAARNSESTQLKLATPWGPLNVSLAEIGRLWIEEDPIPTFRVLLANLSNLPLMPAGEDFVIDTQRWGKVTLRFAEVSSIVNLKLKKASDEDEQRSVEMQAPILQLSGESRIAGTVDLKAIPLKTATGISQVDFNTVKRLVRNDAEDDPAELVAVLDNDEKMSGKFLLRFLPVRMGEQVWRIPLKHFQEAHLKRKPESVEGNQASQPTGTIKAGNAARPTDGSSPSPTVHPPRVDPPRVEPPRVEPPSTTAM